MASASHQTLVLSSTSCNINLVPSHQPAPLPDLRHSCCVVRFCAAAAYYSIQSTEHPRNLDRRSASPIYQTIGASIFHSFHRQFRDIPMKSFTATTSTTLLLLVCTFLSLLLSTRGFAPAIPQYSSSSSSAAAVLRRSTEASSISGRSIATLSPLSSRQGVRHPHQSDTTRLYMSSLEKSKVTKKSVLVKDRTETQPAEQKKKEEQWRVVLHNDEVHTFNYVIRSLCKVIGTLDRKAAFEICVQTHGIGKATVTKTWKKQAEQFCLGLQRQGLTVSISPDEDFEGGHSGGGL